MGTPAQTVSNLAGVATTATPKVALPFLSIAFCEPCWYAAYTSANHEKRVAEQLEVRNVEHFLPLYDSVRRWKDRRVILQMPLFPGYVFVRITLGDRLQVLQLPGVARLVGFNGTPVPLPQEEIDALRAGLAGGLHAQPHPYLTTGRRARIRGGPLSGLEGILLRFKGKWRVVLFVDLIQSAVSVEVDISAIEPVIGSQPRASQRGESIYRFDGAPKDQEAAGSKTSWKASLRTRASCRR